MGTLVMVVTVLLGCATACTARSAPAPVQFTTLTQTTTETRTRAPHDPLPTVRPESTVAPLPPGAHPAPGERERPCPYLASTAAQNPRTNVEDLNGSHVYRTTVLIGTRPVGCRFYFYSSPYQAQVEVALHRWRDHTQAHNALVVAADHGSDAQSLTDLVPGVDAVLFRTRFFGPDGARDWACAFALGRLVVTVRTDRTDTSLDARLLARAVATAVAP